MPTAVSPSWCRPAYRRLPFFEVFNGTAQGWLRKVFEGLWIALHEENVHKLIEHAQGINAETCIMHHKDQKKLCDKVSLLDTLKLFIFSIQCIRW